MAASLKNFVRLSGVQRIICSAGKNNKWILNSLRGETVRKNFHSCFMNARCKLQNADRRTLIFATGTAGLTAVLGLASWSSRRTFLVGAIGSYDSSNNGESNRMKYNFISEVVKKAAPAVVYIEIQDRHPFTGRQTALSNGSGFIVEPNGVVLTNAHVVANKQTVVVKLHDGRTFQGVVQAVDPASDLATVKINGNDLPTLKLGASASMQPGEWVVALGSPFQLSNTVTAGIVSTVHRGSRELGLHHKDMDYIQTDATINFGNSGGPLVNLDGEAIGINTMKVTTGISFAIPSDYASQFLLKAKAIAKRSEGRGWFGSSTPSVRRYMGITMLTLTPSILRELRMRMDADFPDVEHGVLVHRVVVGSPAYNGGLKVGDIITHLNDKDVRSATDVYNAVERHRDLQVTVRRGSKNISLNVTTEEVH